MIRGFPAPLSPGGPLSRGGAIDLGEGRGPVRIQLFRNSSPAASKRSRPCSSIEKRGSLGSFTNSRSISPSLDSAAHHGSLGLYVNVVPVGHAFEYPVEAIVNFLPGH
jgi:hypothetical protein